MAMPDASPVSGPTAQVVGNAFVEQYYHILHHSPELVHRFYQDSSALSRPDADGTMITVSTMQAINDKIMSLNYEEFTAEIKTADAQASYEKGVIVLVTGCLTGKDNIKKKFSQTFFLAPQDKGYYVLNDVFRFVEEGEIPQIDNTVSANGIDEIAQEISVAVEPEPTCAPDELVVDHETPNEDDEDLSNGAEVRDPSDNDDGSVIEEEVAEPAVTHSSENINVPIVDLAPEIQEDIPKKSYASILKLTKASPTPTSAHVPHRAVRPPSTYTDQQSLNYAKPAPVVEDSSPVSESAALESDIVHEAEGHSIYVRNLPYDATVDQLEEEFKKFGPIKHDGIQVRSSKQGFCFGFVEFESMSSMQSALEASPVTIGDRTAVVEEKRTSTRVSGGGRGKYSSGRGGFRSDSFRGRPNFSGGRTYGRSEFKSQGEYSGRGRGSSGRSSDGYQRQNGRGGRQGAGNRSSGAT